MDEMTFCESCGSEAIARVHSRWLCARCGLQRVTPAAGLDSTAGPGRRSATWRKATRAAVGSGLAAKVLIGAAALAAVGGVVATETPPADPPPATPPPVSTPPGPPTTPVPGDLPDAANDAADTATTPGVIPAEQGRSDDPEPQDDGSDPDTPGDAPQPSNVNAYVTALHDWTACIDEAVHQFTTVRTSGGFDPFNACPPRPDPVDFDLGNAYGRPDHAGPPDDPGSQRNDAPGRPDDPGSQSAHTPGPPDTQDG